MQAPREASQARRARRPSLAAALTIALTTVLSACAATPSPASPPGDAGASPSTQAALVAVPGAGAPSTSPHPGASAPASTAQPDPGLADALSSFAARMRRERPAEQVVTSTATVVSGTVPTAGLREVAVAGDEAWRRCRAGWPANEQVPPLVVLLPSSAAPTASRRGPGEPSGSASNGRPGTQTPGAPVTAVATTVVVGEAPSAQARIHLDPAGWASLSEEGRRVVLTHECVHVALSTRARPAAPAWLVEGVAEYVAYRDAGVRREEVLAPLFARVAREGAPQSLPADDDFEVSRGDASGLLTAYAEASSAAAVYADLYGEPALLGLVTTGPGSPAQPAQPGHGTFGEIEATFLPQWRHELQQAAVRSAQP